MSYFSGHGWIRSRPVWVRVYDDAGRTAPDGAGRGAGRGRASRRLPG